MSKPKHPQHGGQRPGSGAKKKPGAKKLVTFRLSRESIDYLDRQANKSQTVDEAIKALPDFRSKP
jgi:hypothetical protein